MNESINLSKQVLAQVISELILAKNHLIISHNKCKDLIQKLNTNENDLIQLEAYTSRYARCVDLLFKKTYRSICIYELDDTGTMIDILNKMEKRNLIHSIEEMRIIKDIRNQIAHEYALSSYQELLKEVFNYAPILIKLVENVENYFNK